MIKCFCSSRKDPVWKEKRTEQERRRRCHTLGAAGELGAGEAAGLGGQAPVIPLSGKQPLWARGGKSGGCAPGHL